MKKFSGIEKTSSAPHIKHAQKQDAYLKKKGIDPNENPADRRKRQIKPAQRNKVVTLQLLRSLHPEKFANAWSTISKELHGQFIPFARVNITDKSADKLIQIMKT